MTFRTMALFIGGFGMGHAILNKFESAEILLLIAILFAILSRKNEK